MTAVREGEAGEVRFDNTGGVATVSVDEVAIVAGLRSGNKTISTDRRADTAYEAIADVADTGRTAETVVRGGVTGETVS